MQNMKDIHFKCNLQGTCCNIIKDDIFPVYPSDILRLAPIHRTTFDLFSQYLAIYVNKQGHFMAHFTSEEFQNKRKKFFRCPFSTRTMESSICKSYDYRPLRCRLFPYFPPKPKTDEEKILQWVQPLNTWKPFYGICDGCLKQFDEVTTHAIIDKKMTATQWLEINGVNPYEVEHEFTLLRQLYTDVQNSRLPEFKYAATRVAIVTLHVDLATSLERGLGQAPELIPAVIEVIQDSRPKKIDALIEIGRKKLKEEEKAIYSEIQSQATYG